MRLIHIFSGVSILLALSACGIVPSDSQDFDSQTLIISQGDGTETGNAADYFSLQAVNLLLNDELIAVPEVDFLPTDEIRCGYELTSEDQGLPPELKIDSQFIFATLEDIHEDDDPWTFTYAELLSYSGDSLGIRCSVTLSWNGEVFDTLVSDPITVNKQNGTNPLGDGRRPPSGNGTKDPLKP